MTKRRRPLPPLPAPLIKLDLACGQTKPEGWVGVDLVKTECADVVHDLRVLPWPWPDAGVEEARAAHFFEHLTGAERIAFMAELWRVLIPGGKALVIVPYYASMRAVQDPTHQWPPVCEASFLYFNKAWRVANKLDHYPITCDFDFAYGYQAAPDWAMRAQEARDYAIRHYWNVVMDLHVTLVRR